jgi:putative alpha-1,2-mannosidase
VNHAVLHLPNGRQFSIVAENLSDTNNYVGAVQLNGKPLTRAFIRHQEIVSGGELRFVMQVAPNKAWATSIRSRPYSMSSHSR